MRGTVLPAVLAAAVLLPLVPTPAAAATRDCGTIAFTPQSGDGVFEVRARNMRCRDVELYLRTFRDTGEEPRGLQGFRCRRVRELEAGNERWRCRRRARAQSFWFTTGL